MSAKKLKTLWIFESSSPKMSCALGEDPKYFHKIIYIYLNWSMSAKKLKTLRIFESSSPKMSCIRGEDPKYLCLLCEYFGHSIKICFTVTLLWQVSHSGGGWLDIRYPWVNLVCSLHSRHKATSWLLCFCEEFLKGIIVVLTSLSLLSSNNNHLSLQCFSKIDLK